MQLVDFLALVSCAAIVALCIMVCREKNKLINFFYHLNKSKKGGAN